MAIAVLVLACHLLGRLELEIVDAYNETGTALQEERRFVIWAAEANRAFAHFARA